MKETKKKAAPRTSRSNGTGASPKSSPPSRRKKSKKKGDDLFNQLVNLTGIPGQTIRKELFGILERKKIDLHNITIDQLRVVVASYLREIMGGILDKTTSRRIESH